MINKKPKENTMDNKELKKEFKKYKKIFFDLGDNRIFVWGINDDGLPNDKIFLGRSGSPRPDFTYSPYDIARLEYTKPGLFRKGLITIIGVGGSALLDIEHKSKSNAKMCDLFNECLELYKKYNLGK